MLDRLELLAEEGDSVGVDVVLIEVTDVDGYAIEEVRVRVDPDELARAEETDGEPPEPEDDR